MHIKHILILSFSCLLLACAGSDEKPKGEPTGEVSSRSDCISTGSIRDYTVLDDANLIVTERASRKYHVALSRRAYGLRSSPTIGFQADSSRICGHFDDLVIDGGFCGVEPTTVVSLIDGYAEILRHGKGDASFLEQ